MGRSPVTRWQGSHGQGTGVKSSHETANHEHNRDRFECKSRGETVGLSNVHLQAHKWIKVCISTSWWTEKETELSASSKAGLLYGVRNWGVLVNKELQWTEFCVNQLVQLWLLVGDRAQLVEAIVLLLALFSKLFVFWFWVSIQKLILLCSFQYQRSLAIGPEKEL